MIPLGLVLMTSIAFAVGAVKLANRKVLVQELPAVEGLARVDLICLDKTGTLTEGDIVFDDAHALAAAPPDGWTDVLAWYGAEPEANATARCLREPYPVQRVLEPEARIAFSSARKWSAVALPGRAARGCSAAPRWSSRHAVDGSDAAVDLRDRAAELAATGRRTLVLAHSPEELTQERRRRRAPARVAHRRDAAHLPRERAPRRAGDPRVLRRAGRRPCASSRATTRRPSRRSPARSASTSP